MRIIAFFVIFLNTAAAFGQSLVIRDAATLQGIPDVLVLGSGNSEISALDGSVDLSKFTVGDSLLVQHPSYNTEVFYLSSKSADLEIDLIEKSIKLEEIVVSVSRWAESSSEFANRVVAIDAKDIMFTNPQTSADALMQTGEVYVQKSQQGGGSPMIRGFAANRILLTVDGIRLNNAIYRSGNLQNIISIDANSLERTEVIFGPGSVQYGSDALGGVVNMLTTSARIAQNDPVVKGSGLLRYSSANNEFAGNFNMAYSGPKFASATSISFSRFGDLRMGSNGPDEYLRTEYVSTIDGQDVVLQNDNPQEQLFSNYGIFSFLQKFRFVLADHLIAEAGYYYSTTGNIPRYDRLIEYRDGQLRHSNWYYGPQEWMMGKLEFLFTKKNSLFDIAKLQLAYQDVRESRHDRRFGSSLRRNRYEEVGVVNLNLDFTKPFSDNHHLYYGLNFGFNKVGSRADETDLTTGSEQPAATRYPDGSTFNNYAAYLNYEYKPSEKLNFQVGLRFSQFFLEAEFDTTFYPFPYTSAKLQPGAPSASIGLVYEASEETIVQTNLSTAFRAPNIDDIGKVFDSEPGNVIVPNPDLQPEYAINLDLGVTQKFGEDILVDLTGFYTYLYNAMVRRDFSINGEDSVFYDGELSNVQALTNTGSAYIFGFNAKLLIDFSDNWSLTSTVNYTFGEDSDNFPLRHVSPAFGSTQLFYKTNRLKVSLYSDYSAGYDYFELAPEEQNKPHIYAIDNTGLPYSPSWFTLGLRTSYQPTRSLQVNLGIENVLDKRYRTYSSGIVAPGRNLFLGLRASF